MKTLTTAALALLTAASSVAGRRRTRVPQPYGILAVAAGGIPPGTEYGQE